LAIGYKPYCRAYLYPQIEFSTCNFSQVFQNQIAATLLDDCLLAHEAIYIKGVKGEAVYQAWLDWQQKLVGNFTDTAFSLGFQLSDASANNANHCSIDFIAIAKHDPSFKVTLADYWVMGAVKKINSKKPLVVNLKRNY
jgi:hypothetical protein